MRILGHPRVAATAIGVLVVLVGFGFFAAFAFAGDPGGCKGDPHKCAASTATVTITGPTQTVTNQVTHEVTVPGPTVTVTAPAPAPTVVVKIVRIRTYCTMQRHGWKCSLTRPVKHKPIK
jgi:hypothetical protein